MLKKHVISLLRIALCAAFINALAPTISYLFAISHGQRVVELCTSFGVKTVLVDDRGEPSPPYDHDSSPRCQFCLASTDAVAFSSMPSALTSPGWVVQRGILPAAPAPLRPSVWSDGLPRAPPANLA